MNPHLLKASLNMNRIAIMDKLESLYNVIDERLISGSLSSKEALECHKKLYKQVAELIQSIKKSIE